MIDVRLTATNPEDSTLVPVPCNERGELLTVAPKIEKIPNDVEIEGDLTVTGLINGSDGVGVPGPPGEGVPIPYGNESDVLQIVNGKPAWVHQPSLVPVLDPAMDYLNADTNWTTLDQSGNVIAPEDSQAYCEALPSWNYQTKHLVQGWQKVDWITSGTASLENFKFTNIFGSIITLYYEFYNGSYRGDYPQLNYTWSVGWSQGGFNLLQDNLPTNFTSPIEPRWRWGNIVYLINREVEEATFSITPGDWSAWVNESTAYFRGWSVEPPQEYYLKQLMANS